jgi:hypothetical protein
VAFDEGNTAEPSGRERRQDPAVRPRGTAIQALPQPEASIFPTRRTSIRPAAALRYPASQSRTCLDVAQVPGTWRERPWPGCAGPGPRVGSMPSDPGVYRARYGLEDRAGCDTGD